MLWMISAARGPMLVVDASVLFEVVADTADSEPLRQRLLDDPDHVAPHLVDAEVLAVIQVHHRRGVLDRAWELRDNVRSYDALYVALAEALEATLVTLDERLATSLGLRCRVEVPSPR